MRNFISRYYILILLGLSLQLSSCTPGSCFEETEAYLKATFYSDSLILAPDSVSIYGLNMGILYNLKSKTQTVLLPLNSSSDNCIFIMKINGITDTIEFKYSSYPHLISKECGYSYYHQLSSEDPVYSKNIIKYIFINKHKITTLNEENIRIFY